jgi:hypothetical protein
MSRPLSPGTLARVGRVAAAAMLVMDIVLASLVFYLLGFTGPHHSLVIAGVAAAGSLVIGVLSVKFYYRSMMAKARRAAGRGAP